METLVQFYLNRAETIQNRKIIGKYFNNKLLVWVTSQSKNGCKLVKSEYI